MKSWVREMLNSAPPRPLKLAMDYQSRTRRALASIERQNASIDPSVKMATAEELIEAGWGDYQRYQIPPGWKQHGPTAQKRLETAEKLLTTQSSTLKPSLTTNSLAKIAGQG